MSIEWVNRAIDDLRAWGRAHGVQVDADEIRLLCDYASDYLGAEKLGDFTSATFEELLLSIYPRKVIAPPESAAETIAAARTLVDFLESTGAVHGDAAADMRTTLDRIEPEMPAALADTSRYGMAKSIFSAIGPEALENPEFLERPLGIGAAAAGEADEPSGDAPLPAVRLAPRPLLVKEVQGIPLLADARRLVEWMTATGRTPTARGRLRVEDAAEASTALGVTEPSLLWDLAVHVGLAPAGERPDEEPLASWAKTVAFLLQEDTGGRVTGDPALDEALYDVCDMLYRVQVPVPAHVVLDYLEETGVRTCGETDIDRAAARLAYCGLLAEGDGGTLALTPAAVWALRELYTALGLDAPEAADLAAADAAELIEGLMSGTPTELAEQDITGWLERRAPAEAAAELLAAARGASAVARGIAVTIVDRLGAEAEPAVRECLDDPELRPHAIHWLSSRGLPAPALTHEELLWVSVDTLALAMPAAREDPETFAENMAASGPPAHLIEEMWRVDHPDVVEVLELLGRSLTDDHAAKVARKAAFKARSRLIG